MLKAVGKNDHSPGSSSTPRAVSKHSSGAGRRSSSPDTAKEINPDLRISARAIRYIFQARFQDANHLLTSNRYVHVVGRLIDWSIDWLDYLRFVVSFSPVINWLIDWLTCSWLLIFFLFCRNGNVSASLSATHSFVGFTQALVSYESDTILEAVSLWKQTEKLCNASKVKETALFVRSTDDSALQSTIILRVFFLLFFCD